jgi:hypothetical protein
VQTRCRHGAHNVHTDLSYSLVCVCTDTPAAAGHNGAVGAAVAVPVVSLLAPQGPVVYTANQKQQPQ